MTILNRINLQVGIFYMGTEIKCLFKILRQLDVLSKRNFEKSGFLKSGSPDQFPAAVTITPVNYAHEEL